MNLKKIKAVMFIAIFAFVIFAQADLMQLNVVATTTPGSEMFVDLFGDVNYTYYADGSQYEGKDDPFHSSGTSDLGHSVQNVQFALSIGYNYVLSYSFPDGSIPTIPEDLYRSDLLVNILFDRTDHTGNSGWQVSALTDNLTIDTLHKDSTDNVYTLSDMIDNDTAIQSSTVISEKIASKYSDYESDIFAWTTANEIYLSADANESPDTNLYGTENLTAVTYIWLARYIEDLHGYSHNTVDIDDNTESITGESVTTMLDQDTADSFTKVLDEQLIEDGATDLPASFHFHPKAFLSKVSTGVSGSLSFARGVSMSVAKTLPGTIKSAATSARAIGNTMLKATVKAAAAAGTAAGTVGNYVKKGSSKVTGFFAKSGKLLAKPFTFLGNLGKKVLSTVMKYWWVFAIVAVVGLMMFTPVGPLAMSSIRKYSK